MNDHLLTIEETANYLKVHWQTVRRYIKTGILKAHKIGRFIRIQKTDVDLLIKSSDRTKEKHEIELRYIVKDTDLVKMKLIKLGANVVYHAHVIDHWYVPNTHKNIFQNEKDFDSAKGYGLRIRQQDNGYSGEIETTLEVKRLVEPRFHDTCIEFEIEIENFERGDSLLRLMNHKKIISIDKDRLVFQYKIFKIVIDTIKNYKTAVEIEMKTSKNRKIIIPKIKKIAKELGLSEIDRTEKSLTHEAMREFAEF